MKKKGIKNEHMSKQEKRKMVHMFVIPYKMRNFWTEKKYLLFSYLFIM